MPLSLEIARALNVIEARGEYEGFTPVGSSPAAVQLLTRWLHKAQELEKLLDATNCAMTGKTYGNA